MRFEAKKLCTFIRMLHGFLCFAAEKERRLPQFKQKRINHPYKKVPMFKIGSDG